MADLSTAEGILREMWEVRSNRAKLTPEEVSNRQRAAWKAARKLLGVAPAAKESASEED